MKNIVFFDLEVTQKNKITDIGAITAFGHTFHDKDLIKFYDFINQYTYIVGHNIFKHDLNYIKLPKTITPIDTLLWSPLLYPSQPYHHLLKDDKWLETDLNDPVNDAKKAKELFFSLVNKFNELDAEMKAIFYELLNDNVGYDGLFNYVGYKKRTRNIVRVIQTYFKESICENNHLKKLIKDKPVSLAYALSIIKYTHDSILPPWVNYTYPDTGNIIHQLRSVKCRRGCSYCENNLDEVKALKAFFNYESFRQFSGRDIQRKAVKDAIDEHSLLVVFPTGGGKSLTFQLPALIAGKNEGGLTVVISPLQALMKDQIDDLEKHSITTAVTINGLIGPIERQKAFTALNYGTAHILYIAPEMLRSKGIEKVLAKRNVVRFVIDEAHCFSTWGQDFRIDYQYIGKFIKSLNKQANKTIPVSCFTATAKPQVIDDIKTYFKDVLDIEFKDHIYTGSRTNLSYHVRQVKDDQERYKTLRDILSASKEPTIIYTNRTIRSQQLAERLNADGFEATYYHGQLDKEVKIKNQDAFMNGEINIIVATTAFGMGVNKDDVKNVIHYNISNSLENYVQEAGRGGRSKDIQAHCYILFNEADLNEHFNLLNQTKLSIDEIKQVWSAIKRLTGKRDTLFISPLELARVAGWDEEEMGIETKIKTAVNELERANYIERQENNPSVFATSLHVANIKQGEALMKKSESLLAQQSIANALLSRLLTIKHTQRDHPIAKVDLISGQLPVEKETLIQIINWMREVGILDDDRDIISYIGSVSERKIYHLLNTLKDIETHLYSHIKNTPTTTDYKSIVEHFLNETTLNVNINQIVRIINYLVQEKHLIKGNTIKKYVYQYHWTEDINTIKKDREETYNIASKVIEYLFKVASELKEKKQQEISVNFSYKDIQDYYQKTLFKETLDYDTIESVLHFLSKNNVIRIDGGFFVFYNSMKIVRQVKEQQIQYKKADYKHLEQHYKHKNQQIHIVGEYAKLMIKDNQLAQKFLNDYFTVSFDDFVSKYYKNKEAELDISQTKDKYDLIYEGLSTSQQQIIKDDAQYITVFAGPGSGKTRLLVHKLASLALLEDVKARQILMLTFSNVAALEFKTRLKELIGDMSNYVKVATFHSYCFELLEITGNLKMSDTVVKTATEKILNNEVCMSKITRTMLLIDEAQDMSEDEFNLVKALMEKNPDMKLLAVGDSDQNIYEFRDSYSKYFEQLHTDYDAKFFELVTNYRANDNLVKFTNQLAKRIKRTVNKKPIIAHKPSIGLIEVTQYQSEDLTIPIVEDVISKNPQGSTAILTRENIQAINIYTQLRKRGINAILLQADIEYSLYNLHELRDFISMFKHETITQSEWAREINFFKLKYQKSTRLKDCLTILNEFKKANDNLFRNDLKLFLQESKVEDFYQSKDNEIVVLTMHQSKGKEFDNVFIYNSIPRLTQEELRLLYVSMTRAKQNLFIHTKINPFYNFEAENYTFTKNNHHYEPLDEILIPLTHRDINLGKVSHLQTSLQTIYSGYPLDVSESNLKLNKKRNIYYSKDFILSLNKRIADNYYVSSAVINHIVYWLNKEENKEYLILLPKITMKKNLDKNSKIEEKPSQTPNKADVKALYHDLETFRQAYATKIKRTQLHYIFEDKTIHELIKHMPSDLDALSKVYGFGKKRIEDFGADILSIIKQYENKIKPLTYVYIDTPDLIKNRNWSQAEDEALLKALKAGLTINEIAKRHQRTIGAIRSRIKKLTNQ